MGALDLGTKFKAFKNNGVVRINDLVIEQILNDITISTKNDILNATLIQDFTQDPSDNLLETFFCLCEYRLKINQAAKMLYIHRNTLLYRINKIKKITNLDPTHFVDALKLYLILKLKSL
jgi:carbohydrate diacid regulator